jgi:hypothetical protein
MSWSKQRNQAKLNAIYGVDFPDSLFWLHEFIVEHPNYGDKPNLGSIGFGPAGPLELLLDFDDVSEAKFVEDVLLHWRYYRDVPEFFTCFIGECDGEHWGMLLDEPAKGFRGAAAYYNNDGDLIRVYQGLFDAVLTECETAIASYEEEIEYYEEKIAETCNADTIEEYQLEIADYQENIAHNRSLKTEFETFLQANSLSRYEGRPIGLETTTGLDIILPKNYDPVIHQEAIEMLKVGRELWYWQGEHKSQEAFNLMRQAYEALGRFELIRILDAHFRYRDIPMVDLVSTRWQSST